MDTWRIQQLNNEGVQLLQTGCLDLAISKFQRALALIHQGLLHFPHDRQHLVEGEKQNRRCLHYEEQRYELDQSMHEQNIPSPYDGIRFNNICTKYRLPQPQHFHQSSNQRHHHKAKQQSGETITGDSSRSTNITQVLSDTTPHSGFEIYHAVFETHCLNLQETVGSTSNAPDTTITVIYNFAYALQMKGLQPQAPLCEQRQERQKNSRQLGPDDWLKKSLQLWNMCLALCRTSERAERPPPPTLILAAVSNKLFLHGHFCHSSMVVRQCQTMLQRTLDQALLAPLLDQSDLTFFLNCLVMADMYVCHGASAPAA